LEPPLPVSPEAAAMGKWYHRIELPDGTVTPGDRDQSLVFGLYESLLPADLSASSVLDLGANACGLTIEFAKRGARVTAVEYSKHYLDQAEFVLRATGLRERVSLYLGNVFAIHGIDGQFDIVCYLGLSYHVRHPQLALDVISHRCRRMLLASSQTIDGTGLTMRNRAEQHRFPGHTLKDRPLGSLWGWEPTEPLFLDMLASAGFTDPRVVSTSPHPGEAPGRKCGNRTYCVAEAPIKLASLPIVDDAPLQRLDA
jgi:SAM-dependent methyltransferase